MGPDSHRWVKRVLSVLHPGLGGRGGGTRFPQALGGLLGSSGWPPGREGETHPSHSRLVRVKLLELLRVSGQGEELAGEELALRHQKVGGGGRGWAAARTELYPQQPWEEVSGSRV